MSHVVDVRGHRPTREPRLGAAPCPVVIDCTPAGNANKVEHYDKARGPVGFLAQGSEFGFGKMYARGINDEALIGGDDRFIQVVSCNTHNIAVLIKTLAMDADGSSSLEN